MVMNEFFRKRDIGLGAGQWTVACLSSNSTRPCALDPSPHDEQQRTGDEVLNSAMDSLLVPHASDATRELRPGTSPSAFRQSAGVHIDGATVGNRCIAVGEPRHHAHPASTRIGHEELRRCALGCFRSAMKRHEHVCHLVVVAVKVGDRDVQH